VSDNENGRSRCLTGDAAEPQRRGCGTIDADAYGAEKRSHDPSTRSDVRELDITRQAIIDAAGNDAGA